MTIPDDARPNRVQTDIAAIVLIVLGMVALLYCAWQVSPWLLGAAVSAAVIGLGVYLGFER